jgi:hypothetical protein
MDSNNGKMIAACGLICGECDIRKIPTDPESAQRMVRWFRSMDWLKENEGVDEILERKMYCQGCHGERSIHWSPDCWILACCVDQKHLSYCSQCEEFPCQRLLTWSEEREEYRQALATLESMGQE